MVVRVNGVLFRIPVVRADASDPVSFIFFLTLCSLINFQQQHQRQMKQARKKIQEITKVYEAFKPYPGFNADLYLILEEPAHRYQI